MSRLALVTGANRGLGARTAQELAAKGLRVLVGARDATSAAAVCRELPGDGHAVLELDLDRPDAWPADLDDIGVDVLVNNAAVLVEGVALQADPVGMDASWRTNVVGPWRLAQRLVPGMVARGYGRVVNVSSGGGSFGEGSMMTGHVPYAVTKAALNALTVTLAASVAGDVKVNAVCPGWVRTRMGGDAAPRGVDEGAAGIVWAATLGPDGPNGGFFRDGEPVPW